VEGESNYNLKVCFKLLSVPDHVTASFQAKQSPLSRPVLSEATGLGIASGFALAMTVATGLQPYTLAWQDNKK
jgi:hypothetical protein